MPPATLGSPLHGGDRGAMKYVPSFGLKAQVFMLCAAPVFAFIVTPKDRGIEMIPFFGGMAVILAVIAWYTLKVITHRIDLVDGHLVAYTAFRSRVIPVEDIISIGPSAEWNMFLIRVRGQRPIRAFWRNGYGAFAEDLTTKHPSITFSYSWRKPKTDQYMSSCYSELTDDELEATRRLLSDAALAA